MVYNIHKKDDKPKRGIFFFIFLFLYLISRGNINGSFLHDEHFFCDDAFVAIQKRGWVSFLKKLHGKWYAAQQNRRRKKNVHRVENFHKYYPVVPKLNLSTTV